MKSTITADASYGRTARKSGTGAASRKKTFVAPSRDRTHAFHVDPNGISQLLLTLAAAIAVIGALANVIIYQVAETPEADLARVMHRFDLGFEPSIPAWFSSLLLLLNSAMLALIGRAHKRRGDSFIMHWFVLALIFLAMSIDESVQFHEMLDTLLGRLFAHEGFLLFPWVVAGFGFALAVFLGYLKFLLHLPRRSAILFVVSGAAYVGGAVGMELIAGNVIGTYGVSSIYHTIIQTVEESLEMAGAILFFYALTDYWTRTFGSLFVGSQLQIQRDERADR